MTDRTFVDSSDIGPTLGYSEAEHVVESVITLRAVAGV